MKNVVSSRKVSEVLGLNHDDFMGMLIFIMLKKPKTHRFFMLKNGEVKITADGLIEIINFLCSVTGMGDLIDILDDMTEREY